MGRTSVRSVVAGTVALLSILGAAGPASASPPLWTRLRPRFAAPARAAMSTAYDPVSGYLVTFGGFDEHVRYVNQTWIWDGIEWAQPIVPTPPSPRAAAGMAFDRVTRQLVLFGGYDGVTHLGDTWTWDGTTRTWTERHTTAHPTGVSGPLVFTDPVNGHVDMVGGFDGQLFHNITWQWTGTDWLRLHPASSITARGAAIAELDRANGTVVVFSGLGDVNPNNTWTWDGSTWTLQSPAHQPPSRFYSSSAYSPSLGGVVIFGGGTGGGDLNDTWVWDGSDWRQVSAGTPPAKRESAAMGYDRASRQIILFGGQVHGTVASDTWEL